MTIPSLIIGAGPTGLGAAWQLDNLGHPDWLLLELECVAGGLSRSIVDPDGFTWDLGGHVQFSHYGYFDALMDELLGVDGWHYHNRESWIRICHTFVPYPFQFNIRHLPDNVRDACVAGLEHAAVVKTGRMPSNFSEWIDRTFGHGIADAFLRPYNCKVWACNPELMDWRWIGDRVAVVDVNRVKGNIRFKRDDVSWGPNNRFRFPKKGGTGAIWASLASRLRSNRPERIRFKARVAKVNTTEHEVILDTGEAIKYERLLSTIPLDQLIRISDLETELGEILVDLEHTSTHVVGIALVGQAPAHLKEKCWMYFPESNCPFYRVTHFSHYSAQNVPDSTRFWSLMAEVAESRYKPVDSERVAEDCVRGLVSSGLIESTNIVHHTWHMRLEHGYPIPSLNRDRAISRLLPALESRDVFSRGRFGAWKYEVSNQDHSFAQGVELVNRWLNNVEEQTLNNPDVVNAMRP